jgi:hypothetical protein
MAASHDTAHQEGVVFGWFRGRQAKSEAHQRVLELEAALQELFDENCQLRDRAEAAEDQASKFRLDFVEAARRASRLERRLTDIMGRELTPSTLDSGASAPSGRAAPVRRGFTAAPAGSAADLWRSRSSH